MPSKKKKYNARFPPARIKKIMQTDDDVGKVAAAVPVIISRALELFIESLISRANDITQSKHAKTLSAAHMKQAIESEKKFDFLRDLVASIPDVQSEDVDGEGNVSTANDTDDHATATGAKPWKTGRPRNRRAGDHGGDSSAGRRRTEVTSDDESTEDADTDEGGDETSEETTCSSDNTPYVQPAQLTQATQLPQAAQLMQHAQLPQPAQLMQPAQLPQVAQLMQQPAQLPHPTVPRPAFAVPPGSYNFQPRLGPYLNPFQQQGPPQFLPQDLMPPVPRTMGMLPAERTFTPPVMLSSSNRGNTDDEDYDT